MLDVEALEVGMQMDEDVLFALQPRAMEGCFGHVDDGGSIVIFLIQDQMPFWLVEFFEHDLHIAFDERHGVPLVSLRYRHFQVSLPIYNGLPTSGLLSFCVLELDGLVVQKVNTYRLSKQMSEAMREAISHLPTKESAAIYKQFDALKGSELEADLFEEGVCDILQAVTG